MKKRLMSMEMELKAGNFTVYRRMESRNIKVLERAATRQFAYLRNMMGGKP